jgi:hypothetical protein
MAYFNPQTLSFSYDPPGVRIPTVALFLGMPILGLAFAMFLPAAGFYLVGKWLLVESARGMARLMALLHREA